MSAPFCQNRPPAHQCGKQQMTISGRRGDSGSRPGPGLSSLYFDGNTGKIYRAHEFNVTTAACLFAANQDWYRAAHVHEQLSGMSRQDYHVATIVTCVVSSPYDTRNSAACVITAMIYTTHPPTTRVAHRVVAGEHWALVTVDTVITRARVDIPWVDWCEESHVDNILHFPCPRQFWNFGSMIPTGDHSVSMVWHRVCSHPSSLQRPEDQVDTILDFLAPKAVLELSIDDPHRGPFCVDTCLGRSIHGLQDQLTCGYRSPRERHGVPSYSPPGRKETRRRDMEYLRTQRQEEEDRRRGWRRELEYPRTHNQENPPPGLLYRPPSRSFLSLFLSQFLAINHHLTYHIYFNHYYNHHDFYLPWLCR